MLINRCKYCFNNLIKRKKENKKVFANRQFCSLRCSLKYQYKNGLRNPKTITQKAHEANRGKKQPPFSLERRRNMSIAMMGNTHGRGWKPTLEQRRKISEAGKGRICSEETKLKKSIAAKKSGVGKWMKGRKPSAETLRKILKRRIMSSLEIRVQKVISLYNLPYKFVGNGDFFIERKNPDFININGEKKAIEVYARTHKENFRHITIDEWKRERQAIFRKYGWEIVFIEDWQTNKEKTILSLLKGGHQD